MAKMELKEELEKEAKKYAEGMAKYYASTHEGYIPSQFEKYLRKAVEYGYNKANEWHNLEENPTDLPKENMKQMIVQDLDGDYYMGWYCVHQKCWYDNECPDTTDYPIKVIKWKEISN